MSSLFSATKKSTLVNPAIRYTDFSAMFARKIIKFDLITLISIAIVTALLKWGNVSWFDTHSNQTLVFYLVPLIWFIALAWSNAWIFSNLPTPSELYVRVMKAGIFTFVALAGISFLFKLNFSREYVITTGLVGTSFLLLQRKLWKVRHEHLCQKLSLKKRGLFISLTPEHKDFAQVQLDFSDTKLDFYVHGSDSKLHGSGLRELIIKDGIDFVVPCPEFVNNTYAMMQLIEKIDRLNCQLYFPDYLGVFASRRVQMQVGSSSYTILSEPPILHSKAIFKRAVDILFATLALVILSPVFLVISLLIKISSRGPIFYVDSRIGKNGELFKFPKFRTMRVGADQERLEILGRPDEEMTGRYKKDPRITKFGRILRRLSLDEIPQFACVLVGSMSIVGPRPILAEEISQIDARTMYRQIALPGLTGLWQVSGRKETTWEERMQMDIKYVCEWSPALDLFLVLRTIRVVITGSGAY